METKSPAVLWYTSDFLTGTMLYTDEQLGRYTRGLCYQHQHEGLTEQELEAICKGDQFVMSKFIKDKDGKYHNPRMKLEIEKRSDYSKSRSGNRKGKPNKTKATSNYHMKNISKSYEKHMDNDNDNEIDNININNIYTFIEQNFGRPLSPIEYEKIEHWQKSFNDEMVKYAIELSVYSNAKNFKYVEGILKNWKGCNYTTLDECKQDKPYQAKREVVEIPDYNWLEDHE